MMSFLVQDQKNMVRNFTKIPPIKNPIKKLNKENPIPIQKPSKNNEKFIGFHEFFLLAPLQTIFVNKQTRKPISINFP
jgi:hypothetical protein